MSNTKILQNNIPALLKALDGMSLLPAARNGGLFVVNEARTLAAVDTGAMRESIHIEDAEVTESSAFVNVGPEVDYAIYQEFGTSKMKAQPFMRPAVDGNENQIVNVVGETVKMIIKANT